MISMRNHIYFNVKLMYVSSYTAPRHETLYGARNYYEVVSYF